jgi:hypothetical protein
MYKSVSQVAKELQMPVSKLNYAWLAGHVPHARKIGSSRVWTEKQVETVKQYFCPRGKDE